MKNIPLYKVHMPDQDKLMSRLREVLYSGFVTEGVEVKEFEEAFKKKFKLCNRPLSVNSGTSALQLAYRLCKTDKKKIVLTSPMSCFANVCSIINEGLKIVWCDIDPRTGNISPEDVGEKISLYGEKNIAAVSFVDLGGFPNDLWKLHSEVDEKCMLIQDAAQSLGSKYFNCFPGQSGLVDLVAYSFQAIKHLTTVDGGMLVADENVVRARKLKWFGINREAAKEETRWHYDIPEHGYKFHMNNVNATIGLCQLENIDWVIDRHKDNGKWYDENLKGLNGIKLPFIPESSEPSYWIYPLRVERREDFAKMMKDKGISVNIAHVRNDSYSCVKNADHVLNHTEELPGMNEYEKEYIFIPSGWWVLEDDREYIKECIKNGW